MERQHQTSGSIINCRRCGQVFRRQGEAYCKVCAREIQEATHRVYDYLHQNPGQTIQEIARACDVVERDIEAMIYEGGLGTAAASVMVHCYRCSRITPLSRQKGRFCADCADAVEEGARLEQALRKEGTHKPSTKAVPEKGTKIPDQSSHRQTESSPAQPGLETEEAPRSRGLPPEVAGENFNPYGFKRHYR